SAVGLAGSWRQVRLAAMLPLVGAAACTVPVGSLVAARLPEPTLLAGLGPLVGGAVLQEMSGARAPAVQGVRGEFAAGVVSGVMNSYAGVGGQALSEDAVNAGGATGELVPKALVY
ncbi:hypothetical protein, partial [Saccharothrix sp. ST-888]|uniref:hypothetical protein n=1 Tax=Saccharothrix sp. ST-888 TaxID=1427391 RepID=UPI0005EC34A3